MMQKNNRWQNRLQATATGIQFAAAEIACTDPRSLDPWRIDRIQPDQFVAAKFGAKLDKTVLIRIRIREGGAKICPVVMIANQDFHPEWSSPKAGGAKWHRIWDRPQGQIAGDDAQVGTGLRAVDAGNRQLQPFEDQSRDDLAAIRKDMDVGEDDDFLCEPCFHNAGSPAQTGTRFTN